MIRLIFVTARKCQRWKIGFCFPKNLLEQKSEKTFSIDVGDECWRQNVLVTIFSKREPIIYPHRINLPSLRPKWRLFSLFLIHIFATGSEVRADLFYWDGLLIYMYLVWVYLKFKFWTLEYNLYGTKDLIDLLRIDCHFVTLCVPYESYIVL